MELSVVIPCWNEAGAIASQLEALSAQEWGGSWEVIVADNGSTDGSREIVEKYRKRLPGLRLIDASKRRGAAHARNAGARAARGDAIVFCDADDEAGPGWLAAMGRALQEHDFVANRMDFEKLNPFFAAAGMRSPQGSDVQKIGYPPYLAHAGGCGLGVKRALHEAVGGFDESLRLLEDSDYCFRLQIVGVELHFVPDAVMHIRLSSDLRALFNQQRRWAEFNVLMYKRYRQEMRLARPWRHHLLTWRALIRRSRNLLHRESRAKWIRALGWQIGLLKGAIIHRVPPV
jgi:glycosyltransferase involved in cell wall biosynthesis